MGARLFVVITDYGLIKSALSKPELSGRPDFFTFQLLNYFLNLGKFKQSVPAAA